MENVKSFLLSRTILGVIVLVSNRFLKLDLDSEILSQVISHGLDFVGAALAVYGRVNAKDKLKLF